MSLVNRIHNFLDTQRLEEAGLGVSISKLRELGKKYNLVKVAKERNGYGFHFKTKAQMVAFKNATKKHYEKELEHSREGKVGDLFRILIEPE